MTTYEEAMKVHSLGGTIISLATGLIYKEGTCYDSERDVLTTKPIDEEEKQSLWLIQSKL